MPYARQRMAIVFKKCPKFTLEAQPLNIWEFQMRYGNYPSFKVKNRISGRRACEGWGERSPPTAAWSSTNEKDHAIQTSALRRRWGPRRGSSRRRGARWAKGTREAKQPISQISSFKNFYFYINSSVGFVHMFTFLLTFMFKMNKFE